jgi:ABC-type bacteriocin/lantibiotic exporter with double-glycine peptidase domain
MYEDNLYLSTLYEYLETPVAPTRGTRRAGPIRRRRALRERAFTYPARPSRAARRRLHLARRQLALVGENGSGKTTLIKLLTRLYSRQRPHHARRPRPRRVGRRRAAPRIGVIFQDFARYQLMVGENIGAGDVRTSTTSALARARRAGMAQPFIETMPAAIETQLGKWFKDGASCRAGSGRRSRSRARSCAEAPTSSCSTSRPRRWMRARRRRSSSSSARSRRNAW